ncbi:MAG: HAMP domain-containing histidine kinase [Flavobacteriales bacterium]|nr:HAMP domain-containing histidine kinase [Flavobacteriales bacterium]MCB9204583.1 HAMP domain-containing histidine kinase [Flavobacteriales bacterium]
MTRRTIRIVIALATISIVGLFATQLYWMDKAFDLREREFNDRVNIALRSVAQEIMLLAKDSSDVPPVRQLSSNYFVVSTNDTLHPFLLESLLDNEFRSRNLKTNFEYSIYDCFTDSMVYGGMVVLSEEPTLNTDKTTIPKWDGDSHYFGVYFPEKQSYLLSQMSIWLFSSSILLVVIIFFAYTLWVILKQKRLSEIKNDFINNMTHEFKTPISTISSSAELLKTGNLDSDAEKRARYYQMIADESNRLKLQVEKVLQMAQFEKSEIDLQLVECDLHALIKQAAGSVQFLLDARNGRIEFALEAKNHQLKVDELHFTNIIRNLLDNAIKYCNDDPRIKISTMDVSNGIEISVHDNGIGITPSEKKQVFEKFYRVPTGNVHNIKGFGLGLYYVKSLVEAHHGKVKVASTAEGSTFIITLPSLK